MNSNGLRKSRLGLQSKVTTKNKQKMQKLLTKQFFIFLNKFSRPINPEDCIVMVSVNQGSAGGDAKMVTHYLTFFRVPTFCTVVWCPHNSGLCWQEAVERGIYNCSVYIMLMTKGWQQSEECQSESKMMFQRFKKDRVIVIPVKYPDFDVKYDVSEQQNWTKRFATIQDIDRADKNWMRRIYDSIHRNFTRL
jgi:hypothetical protein